MKPYQLVPIQDCQEPLVPIPLEKFAVEVPHPYQKIGAQYNGRSPYYLRQGVLAALLKAQESLEQYYVNWRIKIFDAYRPVEVQQYMVDYTFNQIVQQQGLHPEALPPRERQLIWEQVYQIWAIPSLDPASPPPHSTGGAVDVTLVDATGKTVDMGSAIDELSVRSHPDYYANSLSAEQQPYHFRRQLLNKIMRSAEFRRHPREWWHFSLGDQMWVWQLSQENPDHGRRSLASSALKRRGTSDSHVYARYGRVEA